MIGLSKLKVCLSPANVCVNVCHFKSTYKLQVFYLFAKVVLKENMHNIYIQKHL